MQFGNLRPLSWLKKNGPEDRGFVLDRPPTVRVSNLPGAFLAGPGLSAGMAPRSHALPRDAHLFRRSCRPIQPSRASRVTKKLFPILTYGTSPREINPRTNETVAEDAPISRRYAVPVWTSNSRRSALACVADVTIVLQPRARRRRAASFSATARRRRGRIRPDRRGAAPAKRK
jgi:hypothetical protein